MHIRRHTHTFLDFLMFMIMSLRSQDDANCVKPRLTTAHVRNIINISLSSSAFILFNVLPKYSSRARLKAAFNWFQKSSSRVAHMPMVYRKSVRISPHFCGTVSSEARLHRGLNPLLWLVSSACACNARFLHNTLYRLRRWVSSCTS